jgi:hypothetical protein
MMDYTESIKRERDVALAEVSKDGRRIAELEAVEERLLAELAAMKATCEDYRIQACKPDECRVKAERDAEKELRLKWEIDASRLLTETENQRTRIVDLTARAEAAEKLVRDTNQLRGEAWQAKEAAEQQVKTLMCPECALNASLTEQLRKVEAKLAVAVEALPYALEAMLDYGVSKPRVDKVREAIEQIDAIERAT